MTLQKLKELVKKVIKEQKKQGFTKQQIKQIQSIVRDQIKFALQMKFNAKDYLPVDQSKNTVKVSSFLNNNNKKFNITQNKHLIKQIPNSGVYDKGALLNIIQNTKLDPEVMADLKSPDGNV